jgi:hypothetical protein
MRIQPNPSLETNGPFAPSAIFAIVVIPVVFIDYRCKDQLLSLNADFPYGSIYLSGRLTLKMVNPIME